MNKEIVKQFANGDIIVNAPTQNLYEQFVQAISSADIAFTEIESALSGHTLTSNNPITDNLYVLQDSDFDNCVPELKTGMIVVTRDGENSIVMLDTEEGDVIVDLADNGKIALSKYDTNLNHASYRMFDIVKVYSAYDIAIYKSMTTKGCMLWERKDTVDWSSIKIDTKVLCSNDGIRWFKRHFAGIDENGNTLYWRGGYTSFTIPDSFNIGSDTCKYMKLPKEGE